MFPWILIDCNWQNISKMRWKKTIFHQIWMTFQISDPNGHQALCASYSLCQQSQNAIWAQKSLKFIFLSQFQLLQNDIHFLRKVFISRIQENRQETLHFNCVIQHSIEKCNLNCNRKMQFELLHRQMHLIHRSFWRTVPLFQLGKDLEWRLDFVVVFG